MTETYERDETAYGTNMDFGQVLDVLRDGAKATRTGWNGKGMWIALSPGFQLPANDVYSYAVAEDIGTGMGTFRPYIMLKTIDGEYVPWVASHTDLLAEDWRIAE